MIRINELVGMMVPALLLLIDCCFCPSRGTERESVFGETAEASHRASADKTGTLRVARSIVQVTSLGENDNCGMRNSRDRFSSILDIVPVGPTTDHRHTKTRVSKNNVKSLPSTIAQSICGGPHPCRLDGALGPSYSSSPFRDCTEAFYPVL